MSKDIKPLPTDKIKELPLDQRIEALEYAIRYHNKKYFIDNKVEIDDPEFDKLTIELKKLKPDSPVLYEITGDIGEITHPRPMLSLDKVYTYQDLKKWAKDTGDIRFIVEPKYDGMAARYKNGTLTTRGNGIVGEDISKRLKDLNVIGELPNDPDNSTYGEVIIPLSYFNNNLAGAYKNPRNAVVGIIKSKKISSAGIKAIIEKAVHFVVYDKAKSKVYTLEEILDEDKWEEILEDTLQADYPLDGIVIKVVDLKIREKLGTTEHHHKWEIAYKMPAERKWTKVVDIKDQVGRMGRITSVAVIKPINLSGATVTNVTLHNPEYIINSGIGIGSDVEVTRSGEVIPFITKVSNPDGTEPYKLPSNCPICNMPVKKEGKYLTCTNKDCPARLSLSIEYFFKTLGVEELGEKTVHRFINTFGLRSIIDFYNLDYKKLSELEGFGSKSAQNIIDNINSSLNGTITPSKLLQALGIKDIGPAGSKWIIGHYGFDDLKDLKEEDLLAVKGLGEVKTRHFLEDIKSKWWIIEALRSKGLRFKNDRISNRLQGKIFCITGSFEGYTRYQIIKLIEENGGVYKSSVTKDTNYLIVGENPGGKLTKTTDGSTVALTLNEFLLKL